MSVRAKISGVVHTTPELNVYSPEGKPEQRTLQFAILQEENATMPIVTASEKSTIKKGDKLTDVPCEIMSFKSGYQKVTLIEK